MGRAIARAVSERQWCYLAVPGGSFLRPIYDELMLLQLPWSEVEFFFTDERCVPVTHPASNYGEAADHLLRNPRIGEHQLHRIEVDGHDLELASDRYGEELPERFDLTLLEVAHDGHVASLFANSVAFDETERRVVPIEAPQKPKRRITLTPAALTETRELVVVARGGDKAEAVHGALRGEGTAAELPARIARDAQWFLDLPAASLLDGQRHP